jgi:lauroyl/myristoyl acyltransferase
MNLEPLRYRYLRRVVGTVLGALDLGTTSRLARSLAHGVFELDTPGRRRAQARLQQAFDALRPSGQPPPVDAVVRAMYENLARLFVEVLLAKRLLRDSTWRRLVSSPTEPRFTALARCGRGCVLATAYYGNPAVGAYALGRIFRPIHVLVDTFSQPYLRAWQKDLYADPWIRPVERHLACDAIPAILTDGGAVMMIADHERPCGPSVAASFLGRAVHCYPTLGRLARWFDVPVGVFTCRRGPQAFSFKLTLHATLEPVHANSPEAVVRRVLAELQNAILESPEQYLWSLPILGDRLAASPAASVRADRPWPSPPITAASASSPPSRPAPPASRQGEPATALVSRVACGSGSRSG